MVSALFCLVPEHLHWAGGLQSRSSEQELQFGAQHTPLHRNLGKVTSSHHLDWCCHINYVALLPKLLSRAFPSLEQQVCSSFPGNSPCQAMPVQLGKNKLLLSWGLEEKGWQVHNSVINTRASLQHLLPPHPHREGSTQILCNLQSPTGVKITQCQSLKFSELFVQGLW